MKYKFDVSPEVSLTLPDTYNAEENTGLDPVLVTSVALDLGEVSLVTTGELNPSQLESAISSITSAVKTATGIDSTVTLHALES